MSNMRLLRTRVDISNRIPMMMIAPTKAAMITAMIPPNWMSAPNTVVCTVPPSSSITIPTPSDAPLVIPSIDGPASGLRKVVCNIRPLAASEAPQSSAVTALGSRDSMIMYCHEAFDTSFPTRAFTTSPAGMLTVPINRLSRKRITSSTKSTAASIALLRA